MIGVIVTLSSLYLGYSYRQEILTYLFNKSTDLYTYTRLSLNKFSDNGAENVAIEVNPNQSLVEIDKIYLITENVNANNDNINESDNKPKKKYWKENITDILLPYYNSETGHFIMDDGISLNQFQNISNGYLKINYRIFDKKFIFLCPLNQNPLFIPTYSWQEVKIMDGLEWDDVWEETNYDFEITDRELDKILQYAGPNLDFYRNKTNLYYTNQIPWGLLRSGDHEIIPKDHSIELIDTLGNSLKLITNNK